MAPVARMPQHKTTPSINSQTCHRRVKTWARRRTSSKSVVRQQCCVVHVVAGRSIMAAHAQVVARIMSARTEPQTNKHRLLNLALVPRHIAHWRGLFFALRSLRFGACLLILPPPQWMGEASQCRLGIYQFRGFSIRCLSPCVMRLGRGQHRRQSFNPEYRSFSFGWRSCPRTPRPIGRDGAEGLGHRRSGNWECGTMPPQLAMGLAAPVAKHTQAAMEFWRRVHGLPEEALASAILGVPEFGEARSGRGRTLGWLFQKSLCLGTRVVAP